MADGRQEAGEDRMLERLKIMSDDDYDHPLIQNEDTLRRRAWIDRALAGVRGRMKPAELGERPATAEPAGADPEAEVPSEDFGRPRLYLVQNPNSR